MKNPQRKEKLRKCKYNKKETNFNDVIANNYYFFGTYFFNLCVCTYVCLYMYICMCAQLLQSCLTLCDPMDCNPPGFFVHRIFPARTLLVAMLSSRVSS